MYRNAVVGAKVFESRDRMEGTVSVHDKNTTRVGVNSSTPLVGSESSLTRVVKRKGSFAEGHREKGTASTWLKSVMIELGSLKAFGPLSRRSRKEFRSSRHYLPSIPSKTPRQLKCTTGKYLHASLCFREFCQWPQRTIVCASRKECNVKRKGWYRFTQYPPLHSAKGVPGLPLNHYQELCRTRVSCGHGWRRF